MSIDLTTPSAAVSQSATLFSGLIVGSPNLPNFPEPPDITITDPGAIPTDLTAEVTIPSVDELTQGAVAGSGVLDRIMTSLNAHIEGQYTKGILSQSDVSKVYIAALESTLPQAVSFLLTGQQAYWQAKLVQIQAQNMWLERAKLLADLQTAKLIAFKAQADAATAQMQAVTAQTTYANQKLQLVATLQTINNSETQEAIQQAQYDAAYVQTHNTLPGGGAVGGAAAKDLDLKQKQIDVATAQITLVNAQVDVQRAQTRNTNADSTTVAGIIGVQKDLYNQQIDSYKQDAKNKGIKIMADVWTSAKALDDAVQMPGPIPGNLMMGLNAYLNGLGLPNAMVGADTPGTGAPSTDTNWNLAGKQ